MLHPNIMVLKIILKEGHTGRKLKEKALLQASREFRLEVNTEKTIWLCIANRMNDKVIVY
jgi:hypothetical protein